ncbi:MAG: endonuclease/exonuclease/phosphatase family protein [Dermatophilaceae bacterium]|nr:endonuclease/exonuclease/phosphatase family protein [Dermatophilaceae bacterium]NUR81351.1 endonuclease/exonuclease/phosphatase family protein [Dermatophilaceae bacterium]
MRLASYNVENLFDRAKLLASSDWQAGRPLLEAYTELTKVLQQQAYSADDRLAIVRLLGTLGLTATDDAAYVRLRQNRGRLVSRSRDGTVTVVADGRGDWIGWLELKRESVTDLAVRHTAQVVHDLQADVLGVVEAEDRWALKHFNADQLAPLGGRLYGHVMLIDGNDERGIDVGLLTRGDIEITGIVSHVDDADLAGPVFSRDCPELSLALPGGGRLLVLVNHLKSKGYGGPESNVRRKRQAQRVREIYEQRRAEGHDLVAVVGDLNDTPTSEPLSPLLGAGGTGVAATPSDLRDVSAFPGFDDGGWPGTYGTANKGNKIDYILCSPALFERVTAAGVHRAGVWTASGRWPMYPTLTREQDAASDHAAVWVDVDL